MEEGSVPSGKVCLLIEKGSSERKEESILFPFFRKQKSGECKFKSWA